MTPKQKYDKALELNDKLNAAYQALPDDASQEQVDELLEEIAMSEMICMAYRPPEGRPNDRSGPFG